MVNDTRTCKYCGVEFHKVIAVDGLDIFNEGYCCKFHRKDHERQLIREGKMDAPEIGNIVLKDKQYTDISGEPVYFDGKFDQSLRRKFNSVKEKADFLNKHKLVDSGMSTFNKNQVKSELEKVKYLQKGGKV